MKLKELRKKSNKTQKEMAKLLNMSQTGYNSYEIGKSEPNIDTLKKISKIFGVTIDYLVDNNTPYIIDKSQLTDEQEKLFEEIKTLSARQCDKIDAFILGMKSTETLKKSPLDF